jgi:hypothetical protein
LADVNELWRASTLALVIKPRPAVRSEMTMEITRRILAIKLLMIGRMD